MYIHNMGRKKTNSKNYFVLNPTEDKIVKTLSSRLAGLSISELSHAIGLARTSIYNATHILMQKNLVKKNGFKYTPAHPLLQIKSPQEKTPREQIEALMQELLKLKRGEIIYSIESDEEIKELFRSKKELLDWQKAVAKKGIVLKGVGSTNALDFFRTMLDPVLQREIKKRSGAARFTHSNIKGSCALVSFRDSVIFFSRAKNFFFRIDNPNVAKFTQGIMDSLYNLLEYRPIVK